MTMVNEDDSIRDGRENALDLRRRRSAVNRKPGRHSDYQPAGKSVQLWNDASIVGIKVMDRPYQADASPAAEEEEKQKDRKTIEAGPASRCAIQEGRPMQMDVIGIAQIREKPSAGKNSRTNLDAKRRQRRIEGFRVRVTADRKCDQRQPMRSP